MQCKSYKGLLSSWKFLEKRSKQVRFGKFVCEFAWIAVIMSYNQLEVCGCMIVDVCVCVYVLQVLCKWQINQEWACECLCARLLNSWVGKMLCRLVLVYYKVIIHAMCAQAKFCWEQSHTHKQTCIDMWHTYI